MFKPAEYITKLFETNGAGLAPHELAVFQKLHSTNTSVEKAEANLRDLRETLVQQEQEVLMLRGRGTALVELLYEGYQARITAAAAPIEGLRALQKAVEQADEDPVSAVLNGTAAAVSQPANQ